MLAYIHSGSYRRRVLGCLFSAAIVVILIGWASPWSVRSLVSRPMPAIHSVGSAVTEPLVAFRLPSQQHAGNQDESFGVERLLACDTDSAGHDGIERFFSAWSASSANLARECNDDRSPPLNRFGRENAGDVFQTHGFVKAEHSAIGHAVARSAVSVAAEEAVAGTKPTEAVKAVGSSPLVATEEPPADNTPAVRSPSTVQGQPTQGTAPSKPGKPAPTTNPVEPSNAPTKPDAPQPDAPQSDSPKPDSSKPALERSSSPESPDSAESFELLQMFVDSLDQVERNYVRRLSRRELIEAAIEGMLTKLDPHSDYIPPQELESFRVDVEAEFGGIGLQVTKPNLEAEITITSLIPETPAFRAGLLAGDTITQIDDTPTKGLALPAAIEMMKGKVGSVVRLSVRRLSGELEQKNLTRELIRVATVLGDRKQPNGTWDYVIDAERKLGYVRISIFARHTAEELAQVLRQLESAGVRGLVLDLRQNPGGLLTSAIDVADLFLDHGVIVRTSGRNVEPQVYEAREPGTFRQFAVAVLIDRFSASGSEIVAASLQDHHRAVIIGERSYGKGSVQNIIELEQGRSAMKLTTAAYVRPNGKNIHRFEDAGEHDDWGVLPDQDYRIVSSLRELRQLASSRARRDLGVETVEEAVMAPKDTALQLALDYVADPAHQPKVATP
jgi:carboxyl-terminal processing protease